MHQKTNHKLHHPIPSCITDKSNNPINSTAKVPISESESSKLLQDLKQIKSEDNNIISKQKQSKITTVEVLLITVSAYIYSIVVYMITDSVIMRTATETMITNIHNLMNADNYYYFTPL